MQERKHNMVKRKNPFIRMAVLLIPVIVLLLLSQTVFAQNTYVITDGDRVLVYTSSATDPAAVLTEAGLALGADDTYTTQAGTGVSEITVHRSHTVTINNCGEEMDVSATDETVEELLHRLNITLDADVTISVPKEMETYNGMVITVSRTVRDTQTYTATIPHETHYYYDYTLPAGTQNVLNEGHDGQMLCTASVVYVDGTEISRTVLEQTVITQPTDTIIAVGLGSDVVPTPYPADDLIITDTHIILPTGEVLSYSGTMQMLATAYNHEDAGCDMITATGTTVHIGTVAVDPRVIPLGTRMFIVSNDGAYVYGISTAEDTGSSIKNARVDLYFPIRSDCFVFGTRNVTIYFLR